MSSTWTVGTGADVHPDDRAVLVVRLLAGCLAMFAVGGVWSFLIEATPARAAGAALMLASVPAMLASGPHVTTRAERRLGRAALGTILFLGGVLTLSF